MPEARADPTVVAAHVAGSSFRVAGDGCRAVHLCRRDLPCPAAQAADLGPVGAQLLRLQLDRGHAHQPVLGDRLQRGNVAAVLGYSRQEVRPRGLALDAWVC